MSLVINGRKSGFMDTFCITLFVGFFIFHLCKGNYGLAAGDALLAYLSIQCEYLKSRIPNYKE